MIGSVLFSIAALVIVTSALTMVLPGFQRQKKLANMASLLTKTESEINELNQSPFITSLAGHIEKGGWLDRIFGKKSREIYMALEREESYSQYIAKVVLKSFFPVPMIVFITILTKQPIFIALAAMYVVMMIMAGIQGIAKEYKKRQALLIKDLPNLISKMLIALEVGTPLVRVFEEVSLSCSPLLKGMLRKMIANTNQMSMKASLQILAKDINLPVMYDFVSVVNVIMEKGFREAESDLKSIKDNLRELRRLSLVELTKGNPTKMNLFYIALIAHVLIFLFLMVLKMFGALNSL